MGYRPSVEGVTSYLAIVKELAEASQAVDAEKETIRLATERMQAASRKYHDAVKREADARDKMGITREGNMGWESRCEWFAVELGRQLATTPKDRHEQ